MQELVFDSSADKSLLLLAAFRYALGRRTYIVPTICEILISNVSHLTVQDRLTIVREVVEYWDTLSAFDRCNWNRVLLAIGDSQYD